MGFLSFAGNKFQAVCPQSAAAADFKELENILKTAMRLEKTGYFRTVLKSQLRHFLQTYRWPGYRNIKNLVSAL